MLIQRISPNYLNQSNNSYLKKQYTQKPNTALSSDAFYQTSFCGVKPTRVASVIRKGTSLAKKTYSVLTRDGTLDINVSKDSNLGREPVLCYGYSDREKIIDPVYAKIFGVDKNYRAKWLDWMSEMIKEGDIYSTCPSYAELCDRLVYAIYYKDTKKWDDNHGIGYVFSPKKVINMAIGFDKKAHNQPLLNIIRKGTARGKVVACDTLSELLKTLPKSDEPVIAVVGDFAKKGKNDSLGYIPANVKSVIFTKTSTSMLDHNAAFVASQVSASAMIYDEKQVKALQKMAGKFIDLDIGQNGLKLNRIKPSAIQAQETARPKIEIPEIVNTDKLLTSKEYRPELVGNKAYRLRCLEEMKQRGALKDVEIPRSFAIPCGVFDRVLAANPETAAGMERRIQETNGMTDPQGIYESLEALRNATYNDVTETGIKFPEGIQQEIVAFKEKIGLGDMVMVRSSFNGEDAKGYSAAGLYDSNLYDYDDNYFASLSDAIKSIWSSKWNLRAYMSRRANDIEHAAIKPTVIIQDFVDAQYKFTIYTKDPASDGNKIILQMSAPKTLDPYMIRYDRDTKEIEIVQKARKSRRITLDSRFRVIGTDPINDPITKNFEQWKILLKKVCSAAEEVEREFGAAQDIEGGIKLADADKLDTSQIHFWQTRDQVF